MFLQLVGGHATSPWSAWGAGWLWPAKREFGDDFEHAKYKIQVWIILIQTFSHSWSPQLTDSLRVHASNERPYHSFWAQSFTIVYFFFIGVKISCAIREALCPVQTLFWLPYWYKERPCIQAFCAGVIFDTHHKSYKKSQYHFVASSYWPSCWKVVKGCQGCVPKL